MSGRGRDARGKMPVTRGRGRLLRPGDLAAETDRMRRLRQAPPPLSQPTPQPSQHTIPPMQPTPPPSQSIIPPVQPTAPPSQCTIRPVQPTPPPSQRTTRPVQPTPPPSQSIIPPVQPTAPPSQCTIRPVQPTPPPSQRTTRPVQPTPPPSQLIPPSSRRTHLPSQPTKLPTQPNPPQSQPIPPLSQPTQPYSQSRPDSFTMIPNPGHIPSQQSEPRSSSYHTQVQSPQEGEGEDVDEEEEEEEGEEVHAPSHQIPREHPRDANGKVIVSPYGKGFTPSSVAAEAIRLAIQSQFRGPYHCWTETPDDVKEYWWKEFQDKVSWDSRHHDTMHRAFKQKGAKRLSDMLTKVRKKGTKPSWMGDKAWAGLLTYWKGQEFMKVSTQNKSNRASSKGGSIHTTGRRSHHEVALDLAKELGRSVDIDELFLATHTKKSGNWVDNRSQRTYDLYRERLSQIQTQIDETSAGGTQEVDGARKLGLWQEIAGGKTRGRCYGTADLSSNLRRGVTSLTPESQTHSDGLANNDTVALLEAVARAEEKAARAEARYDALESQFNAMMERMAAIERQSGGASCSTSQAPHHPHYDDDLDDHSLDETSPDDHYY